MRQSKWVVVGLLFLATLLNYLDRQTLSVNASVIAREMQLDDRDLGRLFFAFFLAYGIAQLLIGPLLDRSRLTRAYPLAVIAWSFAGAAAAGATGFMSLFALRVLLGVAESPNWPLALRAVTRVFHPSERALANGLFQCGTSIGAIVAAPLIVALTSLGGWRLSFIVVGVMGLLWAVLWIVWFRFAPEPRLESQVPAQEALAEGAVVRESPANLREILSSPVLWGLLVATSFLNPLQYFYISWLPRFFDTYAGVGFGRELAQRLVIVYIAMDVGLVLGGFMVKSFARRWRLSNARLAVAGIGVACMLVIPWVARMDDVNAITALLCVATFGHGCFMVNYLAFTSEVSVTRVSTAAGLLGGAGSLAGALFMIVVGDSVARSGTFGLAFVVAGLMPLVALAGMTYAARSTERLRPLVNPLSPR